MYAVSFSFVNGYLLAFTPCAQHYSVPPRHETSWFLIRSLGSGTFGTCQNLARCSRSRAC